MQKRMASCSALAALLLAGCGGHAANSLPATAQPAAKIVLVQFRIVVPSRAASARRQPRFVSPSTASASIVTSANGQLVGPATVVNCTNVCSAQVPAPPGNDTFTVKLFDQPSASGNVLSTGTTTANIIIDQANAVNVTFNGVVASLSVALNPATAKTATAATIAVAVNALDADKNTIVGPGVYVDQNGNPLTVTLTDSDTSGATRLSATTLNAPTTGLTLSYNGAVIPSPTISASVAGFGPASATLTLSAGRSLYVLNSNAGVSQVLVFDAASSGNAAPFRTLGGSNTLMTNPSALTLDANAGLFVANRNANNTSSVLAFAPGAGGNQAPIRSFTDPNNPGFINAAALDPSSGNLGFLYHTTDAIELFAPTTSGNATPVRSILLPQITTSFPNGLAFDSKGDSYGADFVNNVIYLFGPTASGNAARLATLTADLTNALDVPLSAAVDPTSGNLYVANQGTLIAGTGIDSITVYAPGTNGYPTPIRTIAGSNTGISFPGRVALDTAGRIYLTNGVNNPNAPVTSNNFLSTVTVYAANSNGNVAPTRTIGGSATQITSPVGIAVDGAGNIYVSNQNFLNSFQDSILVFASSATGNVAPIRVISGSNTGLSTVGDIAVEPLGTLYVANKGFSMGTGQNVPTITVYSPGANGNIAPTRTISGANANLGNGIGGTGPVNGDGGLVLDSSQNLFAVTGTGIVDVFPPTANGNVAPSQTFTIRDVLPGAPALDSQNQLYVPSGGQPFQVSVYAAGAAGSSNPVRTIRGGALGSFEPGSVGVDGQGNVYVVAKGDGTIRVYGPGPGGLLAPPIRSLLNFPPIETMSVDTDGTIYVAVGAAGRTFGSVGRKPQRTAFGPVAQRPLGIPFSGPASILVYAPGANGSDAPIRTIGGSATGLTSPFSLQLGN